jgi:acetyl esterase/lipase
VTKGSGVLYELSPGCAKMTPMTDLPAHLQPFVLPVAAPANQRVDRVGELDFYRPASTARAAAILFVHGGPGPPGLDVLPRDWPVYQGYATAAAQLGLVGVTMDHSLIRGLDQLTAAADDVEAAVGVLRADPQVDPNRIALWFFSGAGLLAGEWLDSRPDWLRCVALTYPRLATPAGVDELVSAAEVIGKHKDLPVLLTRVGLEREELARPVAEFVSAAGAALDIIDVPKGRHGFDMLDHTDESRTAVTKALDWTATQLGVQPDELPIPAATIPAPTRQSVAARVPVATTVSTTPAPAATAPVTSSLTAGWPAAPVLSDTPASRVVDREHTAYDAHDLEGFLAIYSPTARLQLADGTVKVGRRGLREYYRQLFETGCKSELTDRMTHGEWVIDKSITQSSDAGPAPMIALYRVQDGFIVEARFLT